MSSRAVTFERWSSANEILGHGRCTSTTAATRHRRVSEAYDGVEFAVLQGSHGKIMDDTPAIGLSKEDKVAFFNSMQRFR